MPGLDAARVGCSDANQNLVRLGTSLESQACPHAEIRNQAGGKHA